MRINVHTHVFTFASILTKETLLVLSHRLSGRNLPEPLRDAILSYLRARRRRRPGDLSFDDFHRTIRPTRFFNRIVPGRLQRLFDRHLDLPPTPETAAALTSLLEASLIDRHQASTPAVINAFEWLRIGFMKSIDAVTDDLISHMDDDDVAVVLPMDIIDKKAGKREKKLFLKQMEDTRRQAMRYPGRILPFAKVNPARSDSFDLFCNAIEEGACVGLKLYPSLGYRIRGGVMDEVLRFCEEKAVPVLLHCNDTGFRKSPQAARFCDPKEWIPVLDTHASLKVCFAHFGGQTQDGKPVWTHPGLPEESWAAAILDLMKRYPGRVFADLSYHWEQNEDDEAAKNYRNNLLAVLSDEHFRDQVLWGTDFHLLRLDATDTDYTESFVSLVGDDHFARLSRANPARYLGLPVDGLAEGSNITRHIAWLTDNHARAVHGRPASWLTRHPKGAALDGGTTSPDGPAWDRNNRIHVSVFNFIWGYRTPVYLGEEMKRRMRRQGNDPQALFEAMGRLPVGELTFHSDVLGDRSDRDHAIRSFAGRIHVWFSAIGAFERTELEDAGYLRKMVATCSDPSATIPKIAEVMERYFRDTSDLVTDP